jgi:NADH-quinone oxidoreductase subunit E
MSDTALPRRLRRNATRTEDEVDFSPAAEPLVEKLLEPALAIIARYPAGRERSALLPLLHLVQSEEGFITPTGVAFCADVLGINKAQVGAVATFYTMYKRRPAGEYLVSVCTNTLCNVMGGQEVYDELVEHLGVGHEETTGDGKITLEHAECLAACDYAPVVTVNYEFAIDQATPDAAVTMVEQLRNGERPMPARGARLCSLREMSIQLAGFADDREGGVADGRAGPPTLRGVTLAQEHGVAVANFDPDTPITRTKPARTEKPADQSGEGKAAGAARKAAGAVKAAAATVAEKAAERAHDRSARKAAPVQPGETSAAKAASTTRDVRAGDVKDPQVRAAETRRPDASTPVADAPGTQVPPGGPAPSTPDAQEAEAAGVAANQPASDAKPAADTTPGGGDIVSENRDADDHPTADDNPGWTGAQPANEEKK